MIRQLDGETFHIRRIERRAWHTPGHTPEHLSYVITDVGGGVTVPMGIVTSDFVSAHDLGRPDLPESALGVRGVMDGAARRLYASARELAGFDDYLQIARTGRGQRLRESARRRPGDYPGLRTENVAGAVEGRGSDRAGDDRQD